MSNQKACPLITASAFINDEYGCATQKCLEEDCAWWDTNHECCVIVNIARFLNEINNQYQIKPFIKLKNRFA